MSKRSELCVASIVGAVTKMAESSGPHMERRVDHVVCWIISPRCVEPDREPTGQAELL